MSVNQQDLDILVEFEEQIQALEAQAKPYKDRVKAAMIADGETLIKHNGQKLSYSETFSTKVKDREGFVVFLAGKGLQSCIDQVYEPNILRAEAETLSQNPKLTKEEFDTYVTKSVTRRFTISKIK